MKKWMSVACMAMLLASAACGGREEKAGTETPTANEAYRCPMKCTEPVADPGKCPKCGMNMEKVSPS